MSGTLDYLRMRGFDESRYVPGGHYWLPRCSQCDALAINGMATHETGCPHIVHDCHGCGAIVRGSQKYCVDCQ